MNLIDFTDARTKRGLLFLQKHKNVPKYRNKNESFPNELMFTQAYKQGLPIELKIYKFPFDQTAIVQGRIFHIDKRNQKILIINGKNGNTKICTPVSFSQIITAKIIHSKLQ
ncbi:hypothetical protein [Calidifontibacillus erzurumensis]|uniref:hypothetical protein n=1 Tax=Calidifontibacillus erzurumensis TaxID=2741433 RepID=UPI0035B51079